MSPVLRIATNELRVLARARVAQLAIALVVALSAIAALTAITQGLESQEIRSRFQAQADREFDGQPARHPHRMVHYGHFVFRPLPALAGFDPGVDAFTGSTLFLEGHRQNSANFGDVRQSSLLVRFGQLTPAFVIQALGPLVLIFLGFGAIARERDSGLLRLHFAQGVRAGQVVLGKAAALSVVAGLILAPALIALAWLTVFAGAVPAAALMLAAGYVAYLLVWVLATTSISALAPSSRTALASLVAAWALSAILAPRLATDIALLAAPQPTRLETDIAIQRDLKKIGDSHNPDDPYFTAFRASVLKTYGVARVEDLPVNYRGLIAMEGERLTSALFETYAERQFADQKRQSGLALALGGVSPTLAVRSLSMAASGTDLEGHRRFLRQAEAYRYAIVQRLNRLQAERLTYSDDSNRNSDPEAGRRVRIDPGAWRQTPDFVYRPASTTESLAASTPGLLLLGAWLALAGGLAWAASRRLERAGS
ncbi:MAG: ABC transporter permease [Alphaproteobacteria bacterium]